MYDIDYLFSFIYLILAYFTIYSTSADPLRGYEGCNPPHLNLKKIRKNIYRNKAKTEEKKK